MFKKKSQVEEVANENPEFNKKGEGGSARKFY